MQQDTIDSIVQGLFGIVGAGGLVTLVTMLTKLGRSYFRNRSKKIELAEERRIREEKERKRSSDQRLNKIYNLLVNRLDESQERIDELEDMHKKCMEDHIKTAEELGMMRGRMAEIERTQRFVAEKVGVDVAKGGEDADTKR